MDIVQCSVLAQLRACCLVPSEGPKMTQVSMSASKVLRISIGISVLCYLLSASVSTDSPRTSFCLQVFRNLSFDAQLRFIRVT